MLGLWNSVRDRWRLLEQTQPEVREQPGIWREGVCMSGEMTGNSGWTQPRKQTWNFVLQGIGVSSECWWARKWDSIFNPTSRKQQVIHKIRKYLEVSKLSTWHWPWLGKTMVGNPLQSGLLLYRTPKPVGHKDSNRFSCSWTRESYPNLDIGQISMATWHCQNQASCTWTKQKTIKWIFGFCKWTFYQSETCWGKDIHNMAETQRQKTEMEPWV